MCDAYPPAAETGGKQPYSLECWPKRWDGAPLACTEVRKARSGWRCPVKGEREGGIFGGWDAGLMLVCCSMCLLQFMV